MAVKTYKLNDSAQYMDNFGSDCAKCVHFRPKSYSCKAFPDEIPIPILSGRKDHREPKYGQKNDVIFQQKKSK
jgi:hypothetical protein